MTAPSAFVFGLGGIGLGVVSRLREAGWAVTSFDRRDVEPAPDIRVDLADAQATEMAIKEAWLDGGPDLFVLAFGSVSPLQVQDADEAALQQLTDSNLSAVIYVLGSLRRRLESGARGTRSIFVVTSNAAFAARPHQPIYAALKAAVASLVASTAHAFSEVGTCIVGLAPGTVLVERNRARVVAEFPDAPVVTDRPGRRILLPTDIGDVVLAMLPAAAHLTGQTLVFDGGSTLLARSSGLR